jgi:hypothetical protein
MGIFGGRRPADRDLLSEGLDVLAPTLRRTRLATVLGRRALFPLDGRDLCDVGLSAGPCERLPEIELGRVEGASEPSGVTNCPDVGSTKCCLTGESSERSKLEFGEAMSMC